MSKVMIVSLKARHYHAKPLLMTWDEYQSFAEGTAGEGEDWKAVLV